MGPMNSETRALLADARDAIGLLLVWHDDLLSDDRASCDAVLARIAEALSCTGAIDDEPDRSERGQQ